MLVSKVAVGKKYKATPEEGVDWLTPPNIAGERGDEGETTHKHGSEVKPS